MRKVVDHGHAVYFAAHFTPPAHTLESRQRLANGLAAGAPRISGNHCGQAVADIEVAQQRRLKVCPFCAFAIDTKVSHAAGKANFARLPLRLLAGAKGFHIRKQLSAKRRDHFTRGRAVPADNQLTVSRHQIHQPPKRQLDRVQILVDVRMIEFDVVDNRDLRQVVHELRPFIKVGRVVFIACDDEIIAVSNAEADAEILDHAAHQKRRIQSRLIDDPGGETRRARLAMRARDHQ